MVHARGHTDINRRKGDEITCACSNNSTVDCRVKDGLYACGQVTARENAETISVRAEQNRSSVLTTHLDRAQIKLSTTP